METKSEVIDQIIIHSWSPFVQKGVYAVRVTNVNGPVFCTFFVCSLVIYVTRFHLRKPKTRFEFGKYVNVSFNKIRGVVSWIPRAWLFMICVRISRIGCFSFFSGKGVELFRLNGCEKVGLVDFYLYWLFVWKGVCIHMYICMCELCLKPGLDNCSVLSNIYLWSPFVECERRCNKFILKSLGV